MKITKSQLKEIIKEELGRALSENDSDPGSGDYDYPQPPETVVVSRDQAPADFEKVYYRLKNMIKKNIPAVRSRNEAVNKFHTDIYELAGAIDDEGAISEYHNERFREIVKKVRKEADYLMAMDPNYNDEFAHPDSPFRQGRMASGGLRSTREE